MPTTIVGPPAGPPLLLPLANVGRLGHDLRRPEGVALARDGAVWAADARGWCTRIAADGTQHGVGDLGGLPNGIAVDAAGRVVVANLAGSVQRLDPATGAHEVLATRADGRDTPTPNFPLVDRHGRIWVTNTSMETDLAKAFEERRADGFVYVIDGDRVSIAADGLAFANGLAIDADERWLYVAESSRNRVVRCRIHDDGSLGEPRPYGPDLGTAPDGVTMDPLGRLWVGCPGTNQVGFIDEVGFTVVVHDPDGTVVREPTNLVFGGADGRTVIVGSCAMAWLPTFPMP